MVDALRLRRIGDELAYAFSHAGDTFARQAALDLVESAATLDRRSATSKASMAFRVRGAATSLPQSAAIGVRQLIVGGDDGQRSCVQ